MEIKSAHFVFYSSVLIVSFWAALLLFPPHPVQGNTTQPTPTNSVTTTAEPTANVKATPVQIPTPALLEADTLTLAALEAMEQGVYVGKVINPPVQVQDFEAPGSLETLTHLGDTDGTWRVIFFGYMHCPDFCPLTLTDYKKAKAFLGDAASEVTFIYISVDSIRDSPQAMQRYLANFDPDFVGFSPDDATLAQIQPDYGFYYQRRMESDSQAYYTVDHSTRSYVLDREGVLRTSFAYDTEPSVIADALVWYLEHE